MQKIYINSLSSICPPKGDAPDYKALIPNANMRRRMGRMLKMGVASGLQCAAGVEVEAVITTTGLGCLADTEKFLNEMLDNGGQMLNPTTFIHSTFNTLGGQLALLLHSNAYNMTYAQCGHSFENGLTDAALLLGEGRRNVLLGGIDERIDSGEVIERRLGCLDGDAFRGEGAQFFLLDTAPTAASAAAIVDFSTFSGKMSREEVDEWIDRFLNDNGVVSDEVRLTACGGSCKVRGERMAFKEECGEYPTAVAYGLYRAASELSEGYALVYNCYLDRYHSLILLEK